MPMRNFQGLAVLTLESRRGQEMIKLIESYGGRAVHAPAMREVPLSSNPEALNFADGLFAGRFDIVIFLTGVGARALLHVLEDAHPKERVLEDLRKVLIIGFGPKPVVVLREWKVPIALTAPEPNTWHELLQAIDASQPDLRGKRIAVQEYGVSNPGLIEGLGQRGADVTSVPVYRWELPEDTGPLRAAVTEVIASRIDVALFTTGVQIDHFFQIAEQERKKDELKAAMERLVKASIGPMTSDTLRGHGLLVDLEASHPKMGFLVKEAAEQAQALLQQIRPRPR